MRNAVLTITRLLTAGTTDAVVFEFLLRTSQAEYSCIGRIVEASRGEAEFEKRTGVSNCFPVSEDLFIVPFARSGVLEGRTCVLYRHAAQAGGADYQVYSLREAVRAMPEQVPFFLSKAGAKWNSLIAHAPGTARTASPCGSGPELHVYDRKVRLLEKALAERGAPLLRLLSPDGAGRLAPVLAGGMGRPAETVMAVTGGEIAVTNTVMHGDLHGDNVLVGLSGSDPALAGVSIIDLEDFRNDGCCLYDLCQLEIDLVKTYFLNSALNVHGREYCARRLRWIIAEIDRMYGALSLECRPEALSCDSALDVLMHVTDRLTARRNDLREWERHLAASVLALRFSFTGGHLERGNYMKLLFICYFASLRYVCRRKDPGGNSEENEALFYFFAADACRGLINGEDMPEARLPEGEVWDLFPGEAERREARERAERGVTAGPPVAPLPIEGESPAYADYREMERFDFQRKRGEAEEDDIRTMDALVSKYRDDPALRGLAGVASHYLGVFLYGSGDERGLSRLQESLDLLAQTDLTGEKARALNSLGHYTQFTFNLTDTRLYLEEAQFIREMRGDTTGLAYTYGVLGTMHRKLRNFERAAEYYRRDLEICAEGDRASLLQKLAETLLCELDHVRMTRGPAHFRDLALSRMQQVRSVMRLVPPGNPFLFKIAAMKALVEERGLDAAARKCEAGLGESPSEYVRAFRLRYAGRCRREKGQYRRAAGLLGEALAAFQRLNAGGAGGASFSGEVLASLCDLLVLHARSGSAGDMAAVYEEIQSQAAGLHALKNLPRGFYMTLTRTLQKLEKAVMLKKSEEARRQARLFAFMLEY